MTAYHWRTIRLRMARAGIHDPMALPTMHILLDETETTVLESMIGTNQNDTEAKRTMFIDKLYAPVMHTHLNGERYTPQPEGFDEDSMEASFDAFAQISAAG